MPGYLYVKMVTNQLYFRKNSLNNSLIRMVVSICPCMKGSTFVQEFPHIKNVCLLSIGSMKMIGFFVYFLVPL